jgi:hypothetical protein
VNPVVGAALHASMRVFLTAVVSNLSGSVKPIRIAISDTSAIHQRATVTSPVAVGAR